MALSTTFKQCAPDTTKFGIITQNKGHFAVQFQSRSPIFILIKSSYTASYIKTVAKHVLCIKY